MDTKAVAVDEGLKFWAWVKRYAGRVVVVFLLGASVGGAVVKILGSAAWAVFRLAF